jgi:hypothetical protein
VTVVLLLLCIVLAMSRTLVGAGLRCLLFGWWHFLARSLSQVTVNWSVVGMGLVCSAVVVLLGHRLLSGLLAQTQRTYHREAATRPWRWKWTATGYCVVWVLFAITFSAAGIYRHASWLQDLREPWYEDRDAALKRLIIAQETITGILADEADLDKVRADYFSRKDPLGPQGLLCEEVNVIFYGNQSNQVVAYVLIPRDPMLKRAQYWVCSAGDGRGVVRGSLADLPNVLLQLDARYPAKRDH